MKSNEHSKVTTKAYSTNRYSLSKATSRNSHLQLDKEYENLRQIVYKTQYYRITSRHIRIRLNLWIKSLDQIMKETSWKKNRNNYIKLMNMMCQCQIISEPFHSMPPEGAVPLLKNYEVNGIIDTIERHVNQEVSKYGCCNTCQKQYEMDNLNLVRQNKENYASHNKKDDFQSIIHETVTNNEDIRQYFTGNQYSGKPDLKSQKHQQQRRSLQSQQYLEINTNKENRLAGQNILSPNFNSGLTEKWKQESKMYTLALNQILAQNSKTSNYQRIVTSQDSQQLKRSRKVACSKVMILVINKMKDESQADLTQQIQQCIIQHRICNTLYFQWKPM